jgi:hypothetical protein
VQRIDSLAGLGAHVVAESPAFAGAADARGSADDPPVRGLRP